MTKEEFRKYVIAEAQKQLFSQTEKTAANTASKKVVSENVKAKKEEAPSIDPLDIQRLAEEIKKINKKIDLRNPLISESGESLVESILNDKPKISDREHVDGINKKKHINFQNEGEKDKWNRMLNYNVPDDEERPL